MLWMSLSPLAGTAHKSSAPTGDEVFCGSHWQEHGGTSLRARALGKTICRYYRVTGAAGGTGRSRKEDGGGTLGRRESQCIQVSWEAAGTP